MVRARVLARFALTLMVVLSLSAGLAWSTGKQPTKVTTPHKARVKQTQYIPHSDPSEKTITEAQVPAPVISAYNKAYPEATPKAYTEKTKDGAVHYDIANTDKNGHAMRHAVYTSTGNMIEVDETINATDLPAAVQATVSTQYPGEKILYSQRITRDNATDYGVVVTGSKHLTHVILDAKGTVMKTEAESQVGIAEPAPNRGTKP